MDMVKRQLLEALRAFLRQEPAAQLLTDPADWQRLWQLASEQKVLPMAADVLAPVLAPSVRKAAMQVMTLQLQRTAAFLDLYRELEQQDLHPLVVKGLVCRQLYPKPDLRMSADEDLLAPETDFPALLTALKEAGMTAEKEDAEQVVACRGGETGLYLEVHRTLFPASSQAYGGLNRFFEDAFDRSVSEWGIRTLCPEDHLLYLILHSFKHFLHSGFGIRQVCDICLFAAAYGGDVDWTILSEKLTEAKAEVFAANLLEIGRAYLGVDAYPASAEAWLAGFNLDCEDLLEDLLSGGVYGSSTQERLHSSRITLNAVTDHGKTRLLRTVFPPKEDLVGTYPWLEERPWLLPAAWASRIRQYQKRNRGKKGAARESIAIGEHRVELLKKYRIIR